MADHTTFDDDREPQPTDVRLLGPGDLPVLERVAAGVFDHAINRRFAAAFLLAPSNLLAVAVREGEVVGMASGLIYVHPDKPLQLFINEVGVAERCQRQGLGKRLVRCLLERGRELGCVEAWVATEEDNAPARALYSALQGREDADRAIVYTWPLAGTQTEFSLRDRPDEDDSKA